MGIDAIIVANESKEYFYFDRLYNLFTGNFDIQEKLENGTASKLDVLRLATDNVIDWTKSGEDDKHRVSWNEYIIKFILAHPNDTFKVTTLGGWDDAYEIMDTYKEWWDKNCPCKKAESWLGD